MSDAGLGIRYGLEGADGFVTGLCLTAAELHRVKTWIERQWLATLRQQAPTLAGRFEQLGIERYHELAHLVDHAALWPKRARILPPDAAAEIRRTSLLRRFETEFGPFSISNEEQIGWDEISWRIVRPGQAADMGPLHADAWFWDLGHGTEPSDRERVKVWVAVVAEPGRSGLRLVPGSHRRRWRYHGERRHGMLKPQLDEREEDLDIQLIATRPGDAVVFHDRLLHGGALNRGEVTRISFELTLFVRHDETATAMARPQG